MIAARAYPPQHQVGRSCPHPAVSPAFARPDDIEIILDAPGVEAPDLRFLEAEADTWVDCLTWPASWRAQAEREPQPHIGAANGCKDALSTGETPGRSSWVISRTTRLPGTLGTNQALPWNWKVAGMQPHIPKERNQRRFP